VRREPLDVALLGPKPVLQIDLSGQRLDQLGHGNGAGLGEGDHGLPAHPVVGVAQRLHQGGHAPRRLLAQLAQRGRHIAAHPRVRVS
jgi:hypothetical protein